MPSPVRVLYVDDEPALLEIGKVFLEHTGDFSVITIGSASAALELLKKEQFDVIVSDYRMPGMDGIRFLIEVRAKLGVIPFILFTGKGREEVVIQAINNGVDFYLQKGGDPEAQFAELMLKIRQAVQRHKAEADLTKSEANLQAIIANTDDIIASYDNEIRLLVYNRAASEIYRSIFGIELRPGLCTLDLFPDSMRGFWDANNKRALAGESFSIDFNLPMTRGQERFFESSYNPIFKDGVVVGFSTFTRDITERRRVETELSVSYEDIAAAEEELRGQFDMLVKNEKDLRESEERYRLISENTADVIWTLNYKMDKFTYVSPSVQKLRGYTPEEVMTQTMVEALTPESMETVNRLIQEGIAKRKPGDTSRHITTNLIDQPCKDGSVVSTEVVSTLVFDEQGDPFEIFGISRDITERKVAEDELRFSERKFAAAFEASPDPIAITDMQTGIILDINSAFEEWSGYVLDEISGKTTSELNFWVYPKERDAFVRQLTIQGSVHKKNVTFRTKNGEIRDILFSANVFGTGNKTYMLSLAEDITERRQSEDALAKSEEMLRTLLERVPSVAVQGYRPDHTVVYWNEANTRIYGYTAEEAIGRDIRDLLVPIPARDEVTKAIARMAESGIPEPAAELELLHKDGSLVPVFSSHAVVKIPGRSTIQFCFDVDLSERKKAEDTLLRVNQKLNILSQLTRKDLTNLTFILNSYFELLKNQLAGQDDIIETVEKGVRAVRLIHETIEYSKDYQDMGAKPPKWQNVKMAMLLGLSHISINEIQHSIETGNLEIFADALLEKVCQRLFESSVKHGENVTRIRIWHTVTPLGATIFFEDDGIGIPQGKKEQIFLRSEGPRASRGSLIFVREILDITGITITETGEPGKGVRFEMTVPKGMWRTGGKIEL